MLLCECRQNRRAATKGFGEEHLDVTQVALGETTLTIAKVVLPHANEGLWIAQTAHFLYIGKEPMPPGAESSGIVRSDIL